MKNAWKNNKNTQDTKSTPNEVRTQSTASPTTIAAKLVVDDTKRA